MNQSQQIIEDLNEIADGAKIADLLNKILSKRKSVSETEALSIIQSQGGKFRDISTRQFASVIDQLIKDGKLVKNKDKTISLGK